MNKKEEISIFVTGGWDSTFMLCKLSKQAFKITPIYVLNPKRQSRDIELAAIRKIVQTLPRNPQTKATITPIKIINLEEIKIDPEIQVARKSLMKRVGSLGYQYDYLATIAKDTGMIGVGIENSPPAGDTGETTILTALAKLTSKSYGLVVDKTHSDPEVNLVFGNMFFPIADITEPEMHEWAIRNGYDSVMKLTWFCHSPVNGKPCGLCRPCEEKMGSKMEFLLPEESQKRYYKAKRLNFLGEKLSRPLKQYRIKCLTT